MLVLTPDQVGAAIDVQGGFAAEIEGEHGEQGQAPFVVLDAVLEALRRRDDAVAGAAARRGCAGYAVQPILAASRLQTGRASLEE